MSESINAERDINPQDIVRALLQETHTVEPPTNAEKLARYLGLMVQGFDHSQYKLDKRIRAFLWPAKHIIGIDRKLTYTRRTYSILHEIGHYVLPGHITMLTEEDMIVDDDRNLSLTNVVKHEIEANKFAADCLFQLERFDVHIKNQVLSWNNIQSAADIYSASFEATARRWVERSDQPCALIVFNPATSRVEAPLRVMYTVTSSTFRALYFDKLTQGQEIGSDTLAHRIFHGLTYEDRPVETFQVNISGEKRKFAMQLFTNRYRLFGLLTP